MEFKDALPEKIPLLIHLNEKSILDLCGILIETNRAVFTLYSWEKMFIRALLTIVFFAASTAAADCNIWLEPQFPTAPSASQETLPNTFFSPYGNEFVHHPQRPDIHLPPPPVPLAAQPQVEASLARLNSTSLSPEEFDQEVAKVAIAIVEAETAELLFQAKRRLDELESTVQDAKKCGEHTTCLIGTLKKMGVQIRLIRRVVWDSFSGERRAKAALRDEIEMLADRDVQIDQARANWARREKHKLFSVRGVLERAVDSLRAFGFKELRKSKVAQDNLRKELPVVLSYQLFGQASMVAALYAQAPAVDVWRRLFDDPTWEQVKDSLQLVSETTQWPIFLNTILMMTLQENQAIKHQSIDLEPDQRQMAHFEGLLRRLPGLIQGHKGYWTEAKIKMFSFMSLLPFEWAVFNFFSMLQVAANKGMVGVQDWNLLLQTATVNGISLAIFGTYLSVKWAMLEKLVNLGMLPLYREGTRQVAEDSLLQFTQAEMSWPSELNLKEFSRLYGAHSSRAGWIHQWRSSLALALIKNKRLSSSTDSLSDEDLERILSSPAAQRVIQDYRTARMSFWKEWTWRAANRSFDAAFVFGLFGHYVPELVKKFF